MNNKLKKLFLGTVLMFVYNAFSMDSQQMARQFELQLLDKRGDKKAFCRLQDQERQGRTLLWQLVTAKNLDHAALTTSSPKFLYINEQDHEGCTPLHHLMAHKDAKVEDVAFFIKQGACLNAKNREGHDPYHHSFFHAGTPDDLSEPLYRCDNKVAHYVHSEMLWRKLIELGSINYRS